MVTAHLVHGYLGAVDEAGYAEMRARYDEPDTDEAVEIITT